MDKPLRKFWYFWTYLGNYSDRVSEATAASPEDVVRNLHNVYSEDFKRKARIYVFDTPPVVTHNPK